ncbi:MAG: C39 family peptidase [Chloroflexota bacterium]|jgi:hypothetical protein|nr:C39 family peptidase [Chloroflexota bacterium]
MFAKNKTLKIMLIIIGALALITAIYFIPPVKRRVDWNIYELRSKIYYFFNPPGEGFSPQQEDELEGIVHMTQTAMAPTSTATLEPTITPTNYISPTPTQTPSPTPSPTLIPDEVRLEGVVYESQDFNNCGPANLSMALSYWGWDGDQYDTASWLKPNDRDRNVMPYEMVDFVETQTEFNVILRYGGDLELIKRFIAAGYPVLIEKGLEVADVGWMGHYSVITGYDDGISQFIIQDSYISNGENLLYSYPKTKNYWEEFNNVYLVIYPSDREDEITSILGPQYDQAYNLEYTAQKALERTDAIPVRDLFFAWYNYGDILVDLQDYYGAAQAFTNAYNVLYEEYEGFNPFWRITWYRTEPYFAYYHSGRYQDVIDLANATLSNSFEPAIEETFVWRGRAKVALGDREGAIEDFRTALEWHPGWWVAEEELRNLEVEP